VGEEKGDGALDGSIFSNRRRDRGGGVRLAWPSGGEDEGGGHELRRRGGLATGSGIQAGWRGLVWEEHDILSLLKKFKQVWIDLIKRWTYRGWKISNKIWICMELNKEQLSLLDFFSKFGIEFELKIKDALGIEFESNLMEILILTLGSDDIWIRSSSLHMDGRSTHEKKFGVSDLWVSQFTSRIWFELTQNLTLVYLELS
jgi:hypothetical protein